MADDDDDDFSTTLAYSKSPKTTKRTTFQDELERAISARVSRQQAVEEPEYSEYSEEFESDDSLNESCNKKNAQIESPVKKAIQDFDISDEEDELYRKVSYLKNKKTFDTQANQEPEHENGVNQENRLLKSPLFDGGKKDSRIREGERESIPIPMPRESKIKAMASSQGDSISASNESFRPTPQQRNVLKKSSSYIEDNDSARAEEKNLSNKPASLSAPSSLTKLSDKVSAADKRAFSERFSPEGHWLSSPPPSTVSKSKSLSPLAGERNRDCVVTIAREASPIILKDLKVGENEDHGKSESQANDRKSPSVLELMLSTVKEKSNQQENKDPLLYEGHDSQTLSEQCRNLREVLMEQKRSQHKQKATEETIIKKEENSETVRSPSSRSLTFIQTAKKSPKSSLHSSAKSRYLGTLTVLDKPLKESSSDIEAADALRATVYQNWLQKKKVFLQELQKIKKSGEVDERAKNRMDGSTKKEEAIASFQAWKTEKTKELQKNLIKQRQEEDRKMKEIQEIARRKEDSKKAFEKWKDDKEEHLKEKIQKEKQSVKEKQQKEQKSVLEKKKDNRSAIQKWNEQKEGALKEKKKEKLHERLKHEKSKAEKEEKEKKALEMYEKWMVRICEKKERRDRIEKKQKKLQVILEDDPPPPWSPPSRTIPAGK
ncbi:hypothetical protein FKM82_001220 [Ascaphus truei]